MTTVLVMSAFGGKADVRRATSAIAAKARVRFEIGFIPGRTDSGVAAGASAKRRARFLA